MKIERAAAFLMRNEFVYLDNDRIVKCYGMESVAIREYRHNRKNITVQIVYAIENRTTEVRNFNVIGTKGKRLNGISVMNFPRLYNNNEFDFLGIL